MSFELALRGDLEATLARASDAMTRAEREAVTSVTHATRDELRQDLVRAGLGKIEATWRSDIYHNANGTTAGWIYSRAEYIVDAFERGATIRSRTGGLIAIPIPGSPAAEFRNSRGGGESKVDLARRRFGELKLIPGIPGRRPPMLVVESVSIGRMSRARKRRRLKSGAFGHGAATVPLFWLVREARLSRRLNVARIRQRALHRFEARLSHELRTRLSRAMSEGV
ncbi:MAG: DUF6441 family protein [Glycocaulis sp.]